MTDPDERIINRAIACLDWDIAEKVMTTGDDLQDIREDARAALHRLFRDRRRLENSVEAWKADAALREQNAEDLRAELARLREELEWRRRVVPAEEYTALKAENARLREELRLVKHNYEALAGHVRAGRQLIEEKPRHRRTDGRAG